MSRFNDLLGTDFEGQPTDDLEAVIYDALDDPRHRARVPGLTLLMNDTAAPDRERFLACVALTTWAEPAGYAAVIEAARGRDHAPWYDILLDRKFSVDNTYAQLALAVADSDVLAEEKGTQGARIDALRSLVGLADSEYFEEKLADQLEPAAVAALLPDIRRVVSRGATRLTSERQQFDLTTQLIDLAAAVAPVDGASSVELAHEVLAQSSHDRALQHSVTLVHRLNEEDRRGFGEYLLAIGDDKLRASVKQAIGD